MFYFSTFHFHKKNPCGKVASGQGHGATAGPGHAGEFGWAALPRRVRVRVAGTYLGKEVQNLDLHVKSLTLSYWKAIP